MIEVEPEFVEKISEAIKKNRRSLGQNALLWSRLRDIAGQVQWYGEWYNEDEWKQIFTAFIRKQKIAPGLEGGMVLIGLSTQKMSKQQMTDLIDLIYAFGTERGVDWSD